MNPLDKPHEIGFVLELRVTTGTQILESPMLSLHMQLYILLSLTSLLAICTIVSNSVVDRFNMEVVVDFVTGFIWAKVTRKLNSYMLNCNMYF